MEFWHLFTRLADTNLTIPAAAVLTVWLLCAGTWRTCLLWCVLFGGGLFLVAATKIAYAGWGIGIASIDFKGFSGHAMRAASLAPVLMHVLLQRRTRPAQVAGVMFGVLFGLGIGISRLVLQVHSVSEVITGWMLGFAVSYLFIRFCAHHPTITFDRRSLAFATLLLLPLLTLKPAPTESWIVRVAIALAGEEHADEIRQRTNGL